MKIAIAEITGLSPYSQSRHYADEVPKKEKELAAAYEERTWRNRMHTTPDGFVQIPGAAFAHCVKAMAKRLKLQVPGKGRVEFTKYFEAGIMVPDNTILPVKAEDVPCNKLFVPSDGVPGGGKRVTKYFPRIDAWSGRVTFYVFDDIITEDVFTNVLKSSGMLVGIGCYRPENRGFYGRFRVDRLNWIDDGEAFLAAAQ